MNACVVLFILNHLKSGKWEINSLLEKQNHPWSGTSTLGKVSACQSTWLRCQPAFSAWDTFPFWVWVVTCSGGVNCVRITPLKGLTKLVLPRGRAVLTVKQVSNEDEFLQLCTAVTHQDWELWGLMIQPYKQSLSSGAADTSKEEQWLYCFLSTVNDFGIHVPLMAYSSSLQCSSFCSWTPGFSTGYKLLDSFLLYT